MYDNRRLHEHESGLWAVLQSTSRAMTRSGRLWASRSRRGRRSGLSGHNRTLQAVPLYGASRLVAFAC